MQAKLAERQQAVDLRRQGLSYSEIQAQVPVSQASLSLWLRSIEVDPQFAERLASRKLIGGRFGARKVHEMRLAREETIRHLAHQEASPRFSPGDRLWAVGVALYWAEGCKRRSWRQEARVVFTNMDPKMICLMREWFRTYCRVNVEKDLAYDLYIHPNANLEAARQYWIHELGIEPARLRIYLKRPNPNPRRKNVGRTYHGTMRVAVRRSTYIACRIEGWIEALRNHCGVV